MFNRRYGIIIACDVSNLGVLSQLVRVGETSKVVVGYKIGFALGLRFGLSNVVKTIRSISNHPIIYDHQKAGTDIPRMGSLFAQCCKEAGINGIIIFPQAGPETLIGFVKAIKEVNVTPIVGGVMTHPAFLKSEGGYIDDSAPSKIYRLSAENGVDHFVLPGNKPELIQKYSNEISKILEKINLLMPGIGTQGGQIDESFNAVKKGYRYAIVGSAIYKASNMSKALNDITQIILNYENKK